MDAPSTPACCRLLVVALVALLALGSCTPIEPDAAESFRLTLVIPHPKKRVGVYLNEVLEFHFRGDVDPTSVTRESLVVRPRTSAEERSREGWVPPEPAEGTFEIEGDRVRFRPRLGLEPNLLDGGFLPGTTYEVILRGFPAPDGLRSVDGRVLEGSYSFLLTTASLGESGGQVFVDESLGIVKDLGLSTTIPKPWEPSIGDGLDGKLIPPEGPIYLICEEPLDPSTVRDDEFFLSVRGDPARRRPLGARLSVNSRERGAILVLAPKGSLLEPGTYEFPRDLTISLRDFGGNPVWSPPAPGDGPQVVVSESAQRKLAEAFRTTNRLFPLPVPGADGTACWAGDGVITIRFPRAAGDGSDGPCVLDEPFGEKDLHATRLTVQSDFETELNSSPGIVLLRAQGLFRVAGGLSRHCGDGDPLELTPGETLTEWLERAVAEDLTVTVLIAGGDLVIEGSVEVEGPLVLVAGGRIRVRGDVEAQDDQLWLVGDGGGPSVEGARRIDLVLDPPYLNPLVEPLTYCALSSPMPNESCVRWWSRAEVEKNDNEGKATVRYVDQNFPATAPFEKWGVVDDPADLAVRGPLRLLLQLQVEPPDPDRRGAASMRWNPPVIDEVRLYWEPSNPADR